MVLLESQIHKESILVSSVLLYTKLQWLVWLSILLATSKAHKTNNNEEVFNYEQSKDYPEPGVASHSVNFLEAKIRSLIISFDLQIFMFILIILTILTSSQSFARDEQTSEQSGTSGDPGTAGWKPNILVLGTRGSNAVSSSESLVAVDIGITGGRRVLVLSCLSCSPKSKNF